jgi:ABC-type Zn uptake system ZnuABC Zn-binding protein ZnuA
MTWSPGLPRSIGHPRRPLSAVAPSAVALSAVATIAVATIAAATIGACNPPPSESDAPRSITVVTTTTVFADLIANVGGDLVAVTSLVPKNGDVHTFEPKPADVRAVAGAKLLVMNGLGLDDWLEATIANAAPPGTPLVKLAVDLPGVVLLAGEGGGSPNPHLWLDVSYAKLYVDRIAEALAAVDPAHAAEYRARHDAYVARLVALDGAVRSQIATIPEANRKVVMFHDAFSYFARAYGITIVGVAVPAPGQDPSAGYSAQLIAAIRAAGVKAIFSEAQFPTRLVDQLATETGARVVADMYDDSLGDPPVSSYEALMTWDVDRMVEALR